MFSLHLLENVGKRERERCERLSLGEEGSFQCTKHNVIITWCQHHYHSLCPVRCAIVSKHKWQNALFAHSNIVACKDIAFIWNSHYKLLKGDKDITIVVQKQMLLKFSSMALILRIRNYIQIDFYRRHRQMMRCPQKKPSIMKMLCCFNHSSFSFFTSCYFNCTLRKRVKMNSWVSEPLWTSFENGSTNIYCIYFPCEGILIPKFRYFPHFVSFQINANREFSVEYWWNHKVSFCLTLINSRRPFFRKKYFHSFEVLLHTFDVQYNKRQHHYELTRIECNNSGASVY